MTPLMITILAALASFAIGTLVGVMNARKFKKALADAEDEIGRLVDRIAGQELTIETKNRSIIDKMDELERHRIAAITAEEQVQSLAADADLGARTRMAQSKANVKRREARAAKAKPTVSVPKVKRGSKPSKAK